MTDERLERIESILQATVVLTQQNREDIAQLTREVRTIAASLERTNERLNQFYLLFVAFLQVTFSRSFNLVSILYNKS